MTGTDADRTRLSIACLIHSLDGGGAERVMAGLASRLSLRGHRVTLITFDDGQQDRHAIDESVQRVTLNLSSDAKAAFAKVNQIRRRHRAIARAIRDLAPDVVLSFCDRTNIDVLSAVGGQSTPIVISERSDPARQSLGPFWNAIRKRVYRRASTVIALTEPSAVYLREFSDPVHVIHSAIESPRITSVRDQASAQKVIAGAGRLEHEKGFDRLVSAFATATADDAAWRLVIYGDGSQRQRLVSQTRMLGVQDRVDFPGWVRPLAEPLSQSTLFCLPSRYEGFPSVLLEAMSMGVPSISVDCESGPRVIVDHELNGLLVESSIEGLAAGMSRLVENAEEREKLGRAGKSVVEQFSWEKMVDRYEAILRDVVESASR